MFFKTNGGNMSILKPITEKKLKAKLKKFMMTLSQKENN